MNEEMKNAWTLIKKVFPVLDHPIVLPFVEVSNEELYSAINIIKTFNATETIQCIIITNLEKFIRETVSKEFWLYFTKPKSQYNGFLHFVHAVNLLYDYYTQLTSVMNKVNLMRECNECKSDLYHEKNAVDALKLVIRATLLSQLPREHRSTIENFYETALKTEELRANGCQEENCRYCFADIGGCTCISSFYDTNRKLADLDLLEPMAGQVLTSLIYSYIESHIQKVCKDSFDSSYVEHLERWLDSVVISWLKRIYCTSTHIMLSDCINKFIQKLTNFLYETYTKIRINQLFNIIIEFPESLPALEDLRLTLPKTDLRPLLTKKLQKAMETRLLHPGVSTPDILTAYIAAIRTMRVLDPTGLLLETVTQPVHQYLRSREDTVRCVVSSLTEEGSNDLAEELVRSDAVPVNENANSEDDAENWETWMPDPVDADPTKSVNTRRTSDIISMLVNVYGSKELFVNEYRTLLADRLLSQFTCDMEKEIRYLELLKLRFGDSQLHYCEVMLKDIQDSKRINQHIKQDSEYVETTPMSAMIVSAQFWPPFKEEKLELHSSLVEQLKSYTKAFESLKGSRTLCWKNHLGTVELEIELCNRTLNLSVTPIQATILIHFQNKNEWSLDELSRVMQVPPTLLKKKISFWQSHSLLVERNNVFYLVEEQDDKNKHSSAEIVEDFESESAMASAQDQREEELQTFWSYIVGMLMNLDTLPLERIHQMLKMFAFQGPTIECSIQELKAFLDRKVREHQLVFSGGLYKLPKP